MGAWKKEEGKAISTGLQNLEFRPQVVMSCYFQRQGNRLSGNEPFTTVGFPSSAHPGLRSPDATSSPQDRETQGERGWQPPQSSARPGPDIVHVLGDSWVSKAFPGLMESYTGRLSHKNRNLHEMRSSVLEKYSVSRQGSSIRSLEGCFQQGHELWECLFQQSQTLRLSPALSEAHAMHGWAYGPWGAACHSPVGSPAHFLSILSHSNLHLFSSGSTSLSMA